jgi:uncharacterized protein (TIGR03066 family)
VKASGQYKRHNQKAPSVQPSGGVRPSWPRRLLLALCLLLAAGGSWALFEFVIWSRVPAALVGKWVVEEGEQEGATFDFSRNGTMIGHINVQGEVHIVKARVRVEGDLLLSTTQRPTTGEELTRAQRIQKLTARELVLEDDRGQLLKMTRAN